MDLKRVAKDTTQVITSYLTYQAVRIVLGQLKETNLPRHYWFHEFSSRQNLQDGEAFIQSLFQEQPDLALRVMTVRQHLAEEISEFLPEMVTSRIQQANIEHRKQHLEKMTQMTSAELSASLERADSDKSGMSGKADASSQAPHPQAPHPSESSENSTETNASDADTPEAF